MVKVPIGSEVIVNLWNKKKKRGMVKYIRDTQYVVNAESEFDLTKGEDAIVVESYEGFVVIVPEDKFSKLIKGKDLNLDQEGFSQIIWQVLADRKETNGGILSFEELYSVFKRSSIQSFISKRFLKRNLKKSRESYDVIKYDGILYIGLKQSELTQDEIALLTLAKQHDHITLDMIQAELEWRDVRIHRMLESLVEKGRVRKGESYKTGTRYFFVQLKKNQ